MYNCTEYKSGEGGFDIFREATQSRQQVSSFKAADPEWPATHKDGIHVIQTVSYELYVIY